MADVGELHRDLVFPVPGDAYQAAVHRERGTQRVVAGVPWGRSQYYSSLGVLLRVLLLLVYSAALLVHQPELVDAVQHSRNVLVHLLGPDLIDLRKDVEFVRILDECRQQIVEVVSKQLCHLAIGEALCIKVGAADVKRGLQGIEVVGLDFPHLLKKVVQQREKPYRHPLVPHRRRVVGPGVSPAKSEDEDASTRQPRQTQPELFQQQGPNTMLFASAANAFVLIVPCDIVAHVLRVANADVHF
mmetsp:Transcript_18982/g.53061  ORF Transcript_18982/g.53061 Transcript_18982/m.53061 type:complete len:244 (+) Transcript_18982:615-1346(+)